MKNFKKAFTLVELIVVITILAVLGTISFISLQGYTEDARNSIRLDAISKIATAIENNKMYGRSLFVATLGGEELTNASFAGTGAVVGVNYKSGDMSPQGLELASSQYLDPRNNLPYKVSVSTSNGGRYQIAATLEDGSGEKSKVIGDYEPRDASVLPVSEINSSTLRLGTLNTGKLSVGDYVSGTNIPSNTQITSIANDRATLSLSNELTGTGSDVQLSESEVAGMVAAAGTTDTPIVDNSTSLVAYTFSGGGGGAAPAVTQWRDVDTNCTEDDIVAGGITMAGCNSTLKSVSYAFDSVQMFAGQIGGCTGFTCPSASSVSVTSNLNDFGSGMSDWIFGEQYSNTNKSEACPAGWKIPSVQDYCDIITGLGHTIVGSCNWNIDTVSIFVEDQLGYPNVIRDVLNDMKIPNIGRSGNGVYNFGMNDGYVTYVSNPDIIGTGPNAGWIYYGFGFHGNGFDGNPVRRNTGWDVNEILKPVRCVKDV